MAPLEVPLLVATFPKPFTVIPLTVPVSVLVATAVLVLNALVTLEVAVPPLFAAAAPVCEAVASPEVRRILPELLSLL